MQMIPLKERAILRGYTWWRRLKRPHMLGFPDAFEHTERLLICLPIDEEEARRAAPVIPDLIACFQASDVTVAGLPEAAAVCESLSSPTRVVAIGPGDQRWSGLPSATLVDRITGDGLHVAIDLSPDLHVLTAALCFQSGAPLRMCFQGGQRDLFFNVQIAVPFEAQEEDSAQPSESRIPQQTPYTRFLNTVRGMMGKSTEEEVTDNS